jgi:hypothetical protein
MTNEAGRLKDDVAFLRALAEGAAGASARTGAVLLAIGIVFSVVALQYWAIDSRLVAVPQSWRSWLWLDGPAVFLPALGIIQMRLKGRSIGPGSRALSAAWSGLGLALACAVVSLAAAGWRLSLPLLAAWIFPVVLFTLLGASWAVTFAVQRRASHALAGAGSGLAAIACGALIGSAWEWLALSAGLLLLMAVPGWLILRAERSA